MRALMLLALAGCSTDYGFADLSEEAVVPPSATTAKAPRATPETVERKAVFERVSVDDGPTSAVFAREDRTNGVREEVFTAGTGASTAVTDYLFVIDHSTSMNKVLDNMRRGMLSLAADGAFPSKARIAVMTSLPSDTWSSPFEN